MQIKYESCILYVAQGVGVESIHEWLNTTRIYIYKWPKLPFPYLN